MPDEEKDSKAESKEIIETAQERFKACQDAEATLRDEALDDLEFLGGDQWPADIINQRQADKTPCLTINRLPQFVRQITNGERQNRIAALVRPVDDKADIETAEIFQGIIRHIERQSHAADASGAYDTAGFYAAAIGFGFWRIATEYCDPKSFDQDILIKRIRNPFSVYLDPTSTEPDGSDADYVFITEQLTRKEFEQMYPDADAASLDDYIARGDGPKDWATGDEIRVAEYIYREKKKETLLLLEHTKSGERRPILKSDLPDGEVPKGFKILDERETDVPYIKHCKLNAVEILEQSEWPGMWIPVVKVIGSELEIDGELRLSGIVRDTKDPQRQYNYFASAETEAVALEPRAPVVGVEGQFAGYEEQWKNAALKKQAYLQYAPVSLGGQPAPPPSRLAANPNIPALSMARAQAADDMKATAGIYDAQLGARANETSGKAILARSQQGETSNYHYQDNLKRSIEHSCRILVDLIPHIYDTPRAVRIIGEDDEEKIVSVNQIFNENGDGPKAYFLKRGRYDVVTTSGPSFSSRRAQAAEQMITLAQAYPPLMQVAGDLIAENLDIPGAQKLANRLKKALPPQLQDEEGKTAIPPQVKMKLDQSGQMIEQLTQALNEAQGKLETKQPEIDSRERVEMAKLELERERIQMEMAQTTMQLDSKEAIELLKVQVTNIEKRLEMNVQMEAQEAAETAQRI